MRLENRVSSFGVATVLRIVCLSLTVVSMLTGYFWVYHQDAINSIDKKLYRSYFEQYESQLDYVNELFTEKNYSAAAVQAQKSLRAMQHIRTRDKNYAIKRALLLRLIQSKNHLGGPTHAIAVLPYAESWTMSDERDVTALMAYIQILEKIPGKDDDLNDALALLQKRFPGESRPLWRMN